jgi:dihydrolipoamide dehydrogenase
MHNITTDVAIIGAGTAGLAAYRAAVAAGKRAVVIEGGPYGTTCARVGCMPSKLLIAAADAAHVTARWPELGLRLNGSVEPDGRAVMARVKRERDRFVGFVLAGIEAIPASDRVRGYAHFLDDRTLQVGDAQRVTFAQAVIATGSSPSIPPMLRAAGERLIVNDDVFAWDDLPRAVAVFGPGVIGLELGQALHRLGVEVHLFGRGGPVGPLTDPQVRDYAAQTLRSEFYLDADASIDRIESTADGVVIAFTDLAGHARALRVDYVIAAAGRTPNVRGLKLEHTSLQLDKLGVPVFDPRTLRCGDSHIFIAGDVNNALPLLHEAADEGSIAGENAARFPAVRPGLRRAPLAVVFTDPQLAMVGARYADLDPQRIVVGEVSFEDQGRSRVMLRNRGLLHVYAEPGTGRFLGAEMIGPEAEHIAHLLAWALQSQLTIERMLEMPFYHPVVEEGLRTALRDAQKKLMRCCHREERAAA